MKIAIRADAATIMGTGHIMRCLVLADQLREERAEVLFLCRNLQGHLQQHIQRRGFPIVLLGSNRPTHSISSSRESEWLVTTEEEDCYESCSAIHNFFGGTCDWLIVDHYSIGANWHKTARGTCKKIFVIEDLANRALDCDLLLDYSYYSKAELRYAGLVPNSCRLLLGPEYALIDKRYKQFAHKNRGPKTARRCVVNYGGSDGGRAAMRAVKAINASRLLSAGYQIDVIAGNAVQEDHPLYGICSSLGFHCHRWIEDFPKMMSEATLCLGAGGVSIYERLCLGIHSILVAIAKNQILPLEALAQGNYIHYLGVSEEITENDLVYAIDEFLSGRRRVTPFTTVPDLSKIVKAMTEY